MLNNLCPLAPYPILTKRTIFGLGAARLSFRVGLGPTKIRGVRTLGEAKRAGQESSAFAGANEGTILVQKITTYCSTMRLDETRQG